MFCRLCLLNMHEEIGFPLFGSNGESGIVKIIAKFLHLELTQHDAVSTIICNACWQHLDDFEKFYNYVEEKQNTLCNEFLEIKSATAYDIDALAFLHLGTTQLDNKTGSPIENNEESLLDIKDVLMANIEAHSNEAQRTGEEEFCYADNFENNDGLTSDDDIPLKKLFYSNICNKTEKPSKRHTKIKNKKKAKSSTTKLKKDLKNVKRTYTKRKHSKQATDLNSTSVIKLENKTETHAEAGETKEAKNYKEEMRINDEFIARHMQLKCDICDIPLQTFSAVRVHFRVEHKCKGYITCCEKRFVKRILLVDHINVHLNPLYFQCSICSKSFKSKCSLESHMTNTHPRSEKLKYHCIVCDKKFVRKSNFDMHNLNHQTEKNSVCNICQKGFVNDYRLKLHIKTMHGESTLSICNFCGQQFRCKVSFARHVAEHQGIFEAPMQCSICNEWFKSKYALRKHKEIHNPIEAKCEICGRICYTNRALQSHIKYAHRVESNLPCTFCHKTFKRLSNLKEHVAMHTGEKHHKCTHCPREFRSRANMYVHIKRDHVNEWLQAKEAKTKTLQMYAQKLQQQQPAH